MEQQTRSAVTMGVADSLSLFLSLSYNSLVYTMLLLVLWIDLGS